MGERVGLLVDQFVVIAKDGPGRLLLELSGLDDGLHDSFRLSALCLLCAR